MSSLHALIFGVSGISGWAITNNALSYPSSTTFSRITGISTRPLNLEESLLPDDPRLLLVSGVDLEEHPDILAQTLLDKIKDISSVTHVFFVAYAEHKDQKAQVSRNERILRNAVTIVTTLAPSLSHVVLQTGGKWYGAEYARKNGGYSWPMPTCEDVPRVAPPEGDSIFYYNQYDALAEMCSSQQLQARAPGDRSEQPTGWSFTEVRPACILGFSPRPNFMNAALGLGMWLSLLRYLNGPGFVVHFPGTETSWKAEYNDASQDLLARTEIYLALNAQSRDEHVSFNAGDSEVPITWEQIWPEICQYFGIHGAPPEEAETSHCESSLEHTIEGFMKEHEGSWKLLTEQQQLQSSEWIPKYSWKFLWFITTMLDFPRQHSLVRLRNAGFKESTASIEGYRTAFARMEKAKILPIFERS